MSYRPVGCSMSYKLLNGHDDDDDLAIAATQPNNKWSKNF